MWRKRRMGVRPRNRIQQVLPGNDDSHTAYFAIRFGIADKGYGTKRVLVLYTCDNYQYHRYFNPEARSDGHWKYIRIFRLFYIQRVFGSMRLDRNYLVIL